MKYELPKRKDIRVVILTSDNIRHCWVANIISEHLNTVLIVTENKPKIYSDMMEKSQIINRHFRTNSLYEELYFGNTRTFPNVPVLSMPRGSINKEDVVAYVKKQNPDLILLYGTSVLKEMWFETFKRDVVNMHLGLSPYYRGSNTNFWPMYYREPEYVGVTIHIATPDVDAGEIICQIRPSIKVSDTLYDINMDTIKQGAYAFLHGSIAYHDGRKSISQRALYNGDERICKKRDLTENAVLKVFENFNSGMLLEYINDYDKLTEKVKIISLTK